MAVKSDIFVHDEQKPLTDSRVSVRNASASTDMLDA
jgi:hypothetical protein